MDAPATVDGRTADLARLREVILVALVVMIPLASGVVVWSTPGGGSDFNLRVSFSPFDVALLLILVLAVEERARVVAWRPRTWTARIALALGVVFVAALLLHASPRGFDLVFRIAALLAIVDAVRSLAVDARLRVVGAIAFVGGVEALIAIGESLKGGTIGLGPLEFTGFYYRFGTETAAHAGFDHPYHLVCFLLVALGAALVGATNSANPVPWGAAAALIAFSIATTFSRAALITFGLLFLIAMLGGGDVHARRVRRAVMLASAAAFLLGIVVFWNGWHARGEATTTGQNVDSSRTERAREAFRLIEKHPLLGVGPGRYTIALRDVEHEELLPAHNVVLQAAAEGGVVAGALAAALFLALAARAVRRGPEIAIVFVSLSLFFLLDAYPYVFPTGLAITALWLALQEPIPTRSVA